MLKDPKHPMIPGTSLMCPETSAEEEEEERRDILFLDGVMGESNGGNRNDNVTPQRHVSY